jgi:hypothetical protein
MKSESGFTLLTTHYSLFIKFFFLAGYCSLFLLGEEHPCWKRRGAFLLPSIRVLLFLMSLKNIVEIS